jgi:hypothetical protein
MVANEMNKFGQIFPIHKRWKYGVIINDYTIVVGVGGLGECAASFIT